MMKLATRSRAISSPMAFLFYKVLQRLLDWLGIRPDIE
jgi:hypothetical protein